MLRKYQVGTANFLKMQRAVYETPFDFGQTGQLFPKHQEMLFSSAVLELNRLQDIMTECCHFLWVFLQTVHSHWKVFSPRWALIWSTWAARQSFDELRLLQWECRAATVVWGPPPLLFCDGAGNKKQDFSYTGDVSVTS